MVPSHSTAAKKWRLFKLAFPLIRVKVVANIQVSPKKAVYFEYAEYDTLSTQNPKIFIRGKNFACGAQYLKRVYSGLGYFDRKNLNTTNIIQVLNTSNTSKSEILRPLKNNVSFTVLGKRNNDTKNLTTT